jgi:hypothetical protein
MSSNQIPINKDPFDRIEAVMGSKASDQPTASVNNSELASASVNTPEPIDEEFFQQIIRGAAAFLKATPDGDVVKFILDGWEVTPEEVKVLGQQAKVLVFDPLPLIPTEFKKYSNWVNWESLENKGPRISGTTDNAKSNDPSTWADFKTAVDNITAGRGFKNLGFVTDGERTNYLTAIDIDGCRNPAMGEISGWAMQVVKLCDSYCEVTPSETGLRVWIKAELPKDYAKVSHLALSAGHGDKVQVEIYNDGKFFTFTGQRLDISSHDVKTLGTENLVDLFNLLDDLRKQFPATDEQRREEVKKHHRMRGVQNPDGSLSFVPVPPDDGFKSLFDAVGWKPFADRLNKMEDSRFHNPVLEPGELMFCPMPGHGNRGVDVKYNSRIFGVMAGCDQVAHCFGCDWSGDMVKACRDFDAGVEGGKIQYATMYDVARKICEENGLRFEDYFKLQTASHASAKTDANPVTAAVPSGRVMRFVRGDKLKPVRLKWLWRGRILADKLNVFSGEPDVGKGMTTVDFAARITCHLDFPDCKNELDGPKDVLFLSSEDDMEDTIIPRLIVAGADMSRIHFAEISENISGKAEEGIICLDRDLPAMETMVNKNPDIVLIIPDPVIAFLGDADPNKDKEVRPIYSKMKAFAKRLNAAWLFVNHWNKNQNATSINKTSGAKTMVSAPRATWMFCKSPEDPTRYLMMKGKGNLSKAGPGGVKTLAYRIISVPFDFQDGSPLGPDSVPRLVWDGETDHTCDEVLQESNSPSEKRNLKVEQFLTELLAHGARLATDIYRAGDKANHSPDKMKRARYALGFVADRVINQWYWAKSIEDMNALKARLFTVGHSATEKKTTAA